MSDKVIKSNFIKVYPTAYRGQNTEGKAFNPESRLNSEFNITNARKLNLKDSYIQEYDETRKVLSFCIAGYWFSIVGDGFDDLKEWASQELPLDNPDKVGI